VDSVLASSVREKSDLVACWVARLSSSVEVLDDSAMVLVHHVLAGIFDEPVDVHGTQQPSIVRDGTAVAPGSTAAVDIPNLPAHAPSWSRVLRSALILSPISSFEFQRAKRQDF